MATDILVADDWGALAAFLPVDLEARALSARALVRRREIRSAEDLVRMAMVYGLDDMSLRETSAWAREREIADLSDVAVLKRLRRSVPLLRGLCSHLISTDKDPLPGLRLLLIDATVICRQRATGPDFRVHVAYSASKGGFTGLELTRSNEGERLDRLESKPGDVLVGDMGYQARNGIAAVRESGAHTVVRFYPRCLPLEDLDGNRLLPFDLAGSLAIREILDIPVRTISTEQAPSILGRMVVVRKPDDKVQEGLQKKRKAKGKELSEEAKEAERYVMLFTTLDENQAPARAILEIYRIRWQVEMAFKRIKGIVSLGETIAKDMELCECKILAKLLTLLLIQAYEKAFFPWGYPL